ncbi:MAG: metallophosphoesterase [Thermoguttaceae bacterium]|jgi:predicted phosphohydrolase
MRLAWLTDIHLNFLDAPAVRQFLLSVKEQADAVAISGDIAESPEIAGYLRTIDELVQKPVYFVLGNHDFYRGSIAKTRQRVVETVKFARHLHYLTTLGVVELTTKTAILGHDGWADSRLGDYWKSDVLLNDHQCIEELAVWWRGGQIDKQGLRPVFTALADEAARHLESVLQEAVARYPHVIAVTHVPPFRAAARHQGRVSDAYWLPYFASKIAGDVMQKIMRSHPESDLLVLCGHTHGSGDLKVLGNLRVLTGEADYGEPKILGPLEVE